MVGKHRQEAGSYCCWSAARALGLHSIPCKYYHGILCHPHTGRIIHVAHERKHFILTYLPLPAPSQMSAPKLPADTLGQRHVEYLLS